MIRNFERANLIDVEVSDEYLLFFVGLRNEHLPGLTGFPRHAGIRLGRAVRYWFGIVEESCQCEMSTFL